MSDFKLIDSKILSVQEVNNTLSVQTYLRVEMYDYVVDKDKKVLRGDKNHKIDIEYNITYTRPYEKQDITKCPNCGATLKKTTKGRCEYCRTLIVKPSTDFVMSKKTCINQRKK